MAKRREDPPPAGAPAWQSTFADLMNLLLCFFVLLFSMSNMDAEKFEALAASFSNTFSIFSAGGSSFDDGLLISNGMSQLNDLSEYITNTGAAADNTDTVENNLGMGNHLIVNAKYYAEFDEATKDLEDPAEYYQNWQTVADKVLGR